MLEISQQTQDNINFAHFGRSKNQLKFCYIVPLKEKEIDPCVNYKTVLLKMQVFVVFTGSKFCGNKTKDIYLLMTELPGDSYCFISPSLGVTCELLQWSV